MTSTQVVPVGPDLILIPKVEDVQRSEVQIEVAPFGSSWPVADGPVWLMPILESALGHRACVRDRPGQRSGSSR